MITNAISYSQAIGLAAIITIASSASIAIHAAEHDLRIVPQVLAGTAGLEPGVAMEWRSLDIGHLVIRPEIFLSEDHRVGGGGSVLYEFQNEIGLPAGQTLSVGPRLVGHNSDDTGWEFDAFASYAVSLGYVDRPWRHAVGALGALGVRDDRRHDEVNLGASIGAFYSFRF